MSEKSGRSRSKRARDTHCDFAYEDLLAGCIHHGGTLAFTVEEGLSDLSVDTGGVVIFAIEAEFQAGWRFGESKGEECCCGRQKEEERWSMHGG